MIRPILLAAAILAAGPANAVTFCKSDKDRNCFTGKFELVDVPGDAEHKRLAHDFGFVDPKGVGWQTNKGDRTDGASIPKLLQPAVGSPWRDEYIRAAVIHDRYCDEDKLRNVRSWRATHRVFYDAMIAAEMSPAKAKLMYYAVYAFGPKWGWPEPGKPCKGTANCIQVTGSESVFISKLARYDDPGMEAELKAVGHLIDAAEPAGGLSIADLERAADAAHP